MNALLVTGTRIVVIALILYSIAYFVTLRKKSITNAVLIFQSLGLFTDIIATVLMISGSPNSPFTLHGVIGYSSLLGMIIDTYLFWRVRFTTGPQLIRKLKIYSSIAYIWWVVAFVTGALLVFFKS